MHERAELEMLKSALTTEGTRHSFEEIVVWLDELRTATAAEVQPIPWRELEGWSFDESTGNLLHDSGRFFSIKGIRVQTNWGFAREWDQPIICQPEVGILGIVCKKIDGILHFLLQAKVEPGNIGFVQLAPTLQATRSNYTQVHKGSRPKYVDYFLRPGAGLIHLDVLQSEQGSKYLRKRNRNIVIEVDEDLPEDDDFRWVTLGQIGELLRLDNLVNMDTRTVVSCVSFGSFDRKSLELLDALLPPDGSPPTDRRHLLLSAIDGERHLHSLSELISWITRMKSEFELTADCIPLKEVRRWVRDEERIRHESGKYFSVMAVRASIATREISAWCQPLVHSAQVGIIAFLVKQVEGVYHFLVLGKREAGNMDVIELAPTVQCVNDNYRQSILEQKPEFLDYVLSVAQDRIWYDTLQSEEGGRFYREQHRCLIIEVDEAFPTDVPPTYAWMTLNQIKLFIHFNNYFNVEARSLIAAVRLG